MIDNHTLPKREEIWLRAIVPIANEMWQHENLKGKIELVKWAGYKGIGLLVEPEYEHAHMIDHIITMTYQQTFAHWTDSWWARFIRWLPWCPKTLLDIAHAETIALVTRTLTLPNDVYGRVQVQYNLLTSEGRQPKAIIVGYRSVPKLSSLAEIGLRMPASPDRFFGLELILSPWLAEDAVVVI